MRQAGRYLPEYHELRRQKESFIDFCLTPSLAMEATLQPLQRFDLDGAILFADILLVPFAMGQNVSFEKGQGPVLDRLKNEKDLAGLFWQKELIEPVFETLAKTKAKLADDKTLIGFSGGLWSVACYMIDGSSKNGFVRARDLMDKDAPLLSFLMDDLYAATFDYLSAQIEAGAEAIQIFESHAGLLQGEDFRRWVIEPTRKLVSALKEKYDVPIIGFPRGARIEDYQKYSAFSGVDVVSLDQDINRKEALEKMGQKILQGNLSPECLSQGGAELEKEVGEIKKDWGDRHVFNLGHGILPHTPIAHVQKLVDLVRA
jgi:uroporphyrinogen decarboxylase